ncbi:MAG: HAMP domain-containing histidine kinase [Candidatus Eremiobacteraeota bacterium]|nr:HAMP domain-containing histidine kinase [Candidatus Eremiobacteraeota bacterium]MBV8582502.1 HAMP domain-containing histidine kinase [Candidatus Eremiobacteraeota bacterium]
MNDAGRSIVRAIVVAAVGGALIAWALSMLISIGNARLSNAAMRSAVIASGSEATLPASIPSVRPVLAANAQRARGAWVLALLTSLAISGGVAAVFGSRWAHERVGRFAKDDERQRAFLADAAHELRTPLAIAVGYTGILKRGATSDRELTDRIVGDIAAEHERLQRLVERILQLARLDAVRGDRHDNCDAVAMAREAIALVRPLDPARTIDLEAPESVRAAIGEDDLRDALRNLLDNAVRYAPGAPITVRVAGGSDVTIRVADRGPGMDAFTAEHAFDRFFRGEERGSIPGSGLGLSIVRRIVERAGGRVTLDTSSGGTTVELRLRPARSSPSASQSPSSPTTPFR